MKSLSSQRQRGFVAPEQNWTVNISLFFIMLDRFLWLSGRPAIIAGTDFRGDTALWMM
jgi:hypothetical protein